MGRWSCYPGGGIVGKKEEVRISGRRSMTSGEEEMKNQKEGPEYTFFIQELKWWRV